jgi:GGDEF domain-containing protein/DNA-binding XRE family transcriptional regulator
MSATWPAKDRRDPVARQSRDRLAVWLDVHPAELAAVSKTSAAALDSLVHAAWRAATHSPAGRPQHDQLMLAARSMEGIARVDTAIGMAYRRLAQTYLEDALAVARRPERVTVFLAAIDHLDMIAAENGPAAVQQLISLAAERMHDWAAATARVHALGEGVFLVIAPSLTERQAPKFGDDLAAAAIGTLGRRASDPTGRRASTEPGFNLSIGSASAPSNMDSASVIGAADRALHRASAKGGGRIVHARLRSPAPPDSEITRRFGQRVRELRVELGVSMEELARRSGLHRTYIAGVESGHRHPTLKNIVKLAAGLGRSAADLLETV